MALSPTSSRSGSSAAGLTLLGSSAIAGSPANFDFAGISQAYTDLILVVIGRGSAAATSAVSSLVCNADTTVAHYSYQDTEQAAASNTTAFVQNSTGNGLFLFFPGDTALASSFGISEILIPGYASTAWVKQIKVRSTCVQSNASGGIVVDQVDGFWTSTAAITRLQVQVNSAGTFKVGSTAYLYAR